MDILCIILAIVSSVLLGIFLFIWGNSVSGGFKKSIKYLIVWLIIQIVAFFVVNERIEAITTVFTISLVLIICFFIVAAMLGGYGYLWRGLLVIILCIVSMICFKSVVIVETPKTSPLEDAMNKDPNEWTDFDKEVIDDYFEVISR